MRGRIAPLNSASTSTASGASERMQVREDRVSIDQIVLSAVQYRRSRPGTAKNDARINPYTQ
jgi:hypothetical protein